MLSITFCFSLRLPESECVCVCVCLSPGGSDGGGAEERAGQQQHVGEDEEERRVYSERYKINSGSYTRFRPTQLSFSHPAPTFLKVDVNSECL